MARLGRRQPFPPIIKRAIQYQPAQTSPVAKFVSATFAAQQRPLPRRIPVSIGRIIQFQIPPIAAAPPLIVGFVAREFRRPRSFGAKIAGLIQYQPLPPIAGKPLVLTFGRQQSFRRHEFPATFKSLIQYQIPPSVAPVAQAPILVVKIAIERAVREAHLPRRFNYGHLPYVLLPPIVRVQPPFTVHHDEDAPQRSRRNQQQVTSVLNGLLRNGELVGSLTEPALGYKADNPLQWAGAGDGDPKTLHDVIERFLAALNGLGIKP